MQVMCVFAMAPPQSDRRVRPKVAQHARAVFSELDGCADADVMLWRQHADMLYMGHLDAAFWFFEHYSLADVVLRESVGWKVCEYCACSCW